MTAFDVVIFDHDGTLCDTRAAIVDCVQRAFATCGRKSPDRESVMGTATTGLALEQTLLLLDRNLLDDRTTLDELVATYRTLYLNATAPAFPGVKDALRQLHSQGTKCLVISNKGVSAIHRSLDQNELLSLVDLVLGDQPEIPKKPDPMLLTHHILPNFPRLQRQRILMVGDTEIDIQFAKAAGIRCCWAAYGYGDKTRCRALEPEYRIDGIAELPALMAKVDRAMRRL